MTYSIIYFTVFQLALWALLYPKVKVLVSSKSNAVGKKLTLLSLLVSMLFSAGITVLGYVFFFPDSMSV